MRVSHIALWTTRLEALREFYCKYLGGRSNEMYINPTKGFKSYFISFDGDVSLEIMNRADIDTPAPTPCLGFCHLAFMLSDRDAVVELTEKFAADGYEVVGLPRVTGDGFFESVVADPDGNHIELMAE